jgi:hypothetical protein
VHALLDEVREAYAGFYDEAEAVAQSSVIAARREGRQQAQDERQPAGPSGVRRMVPARARRAARKALGR